MENYSGPLSARVRRAPLLLCPLAVVPDSLPSSTASAVDSAPPHSGAREITPSQYPQAGEVVDSEAIRSYAMSGFHGRLSECKFLDRKFVIQRGLARQASKGGDSPGQSDVVAHPVSQTSSLLSSSERDAEGNFQAAEEIALRLQGIADAALSHLSLEYLLPALVQSVQQALHMDAASCWLLDASGKNMTRRVSLGCVSAFESGAGEYQFTSQRKFCDLVAEQKRIVVVEDLARRAGLAPHWRESGLVTLLGIPLMVEGRLLGVVQLGSLRHRRFSLEEIDLVEWASARFARSLEHALRYEDVRKSELLKSAMFEASFDGIVVLDGRGRIVEINPAAQRMFGYDRHRVLGQRFYDLFLPPLEKHRYGDIFRRYLENSESQARPLLKRLLNRRTRIRAMRNDHNEFPVEFTLTKLSMPRETLFMGIVRDISHRQRAEEDREKAVVEARAMQEQLRALHAHLTDAVEEERGRIAREIHDEFGHALLGIKYRLRSMAEWVDTTWDEGSQQRDSSPALCEASQAEADRNHSRTMRENLWAHALEMDTALTDLHRTLRSLAMSVRPVLLDDLGLGAAVLWQAEEFSTRTGIDCEVVDSEGNPVNESTEVLKSQAIERSRATAAFRILQESLTNVSRHSRARHCTIALYASSHILHLEVSDDGQGFPPGVRPEEAMAGKGSLGVLGMQERARLLGGELLIDSIPGHGTSVMMWLPLEHCELVI